MGNSGGADVDSERINGGLLQRMRGNSRWARALTAAAGVLLATGVVLTVVLCAQFFDAYFSIWVPAVIEESDVRRYDVTASVCILSLVLSGVLAWAARRRKLVRWAAVLLGIGLVVATLFSVPQGRWVPEEAEPPPLPANYEPCYSGSNDCGGGG
ncbi:MAG: DUF6234 family protein [Mycetocola sp.]